MNDSDQDKATYENELREATAEAGSIAIQAMKENRDDGGIAFAAGVVLADSTGCTFRIAICENSKLGGIVEGLLLNRFLNEATSALVDEIMHVRTILATATMLNTDEELEIFARDLVTDTLEASEEDTPKLVDTLVKSIKEARAKAKDMMTVISRMAAAAKD